MDKFQIFASPWWVNLFILVPFLAYFSWRNKIKIPQNVLWLTAIFGIAFGYTEAASVVYLRGFAGIVSTHFTQTALQMPQTFSADFPQTLLKIDSVREFATIVMLVALSLLAVREKYSRWAIFFWTFAFWDVVYYLGLKATIGWPQSLTAPDVLFLIPVPWYSQAWYPILISLLLIFAVVFANQKKREA